MSPNCWLVPESPLYKLDTAHGLGKFHDGKWKQHHECKQDFHGPPNNTFNYLFQPSSHSLTLSGADVSDLGFQTIAYAATGMIGDTALNILVIIQ